MEIPETTTASGRPMVRVYSLDDILQGGGGGGGDITESVVGKKRLSAPEIRTSQMQVSSDGRRRGRRKPRPGM